MKVDRLWAAQRYSVELRELYASMQDDARGKRRHSISQMHRCLTEACQRAIWLVAFTSGETFGADQMPRDLRKLNVELSRSTYQVHGHRISEIATDLETIQNLDGQNLRETTNDAIHSHVYFLYRMTRAEENYPELVLRAARRLIELAIGSLQSAFPQDSFLQEQLQSID
jgi:hypothetical protein